MADGVPTRTWDSLCRDCIHFTDGSCDAGYITSGEEDCIAAICKGFAPIKKGDA